MLCSMHPRRELPTAGKGHAVANLRQYQCQRLGRRGAPLSLTRASQHACLLLTPWGSRTIVRSDSYAYLMTWHLWRAPLFLFAIAHRRLIRHPDVACSAPSAEGNMSGSQPAGAVHGALSVREAAARLADLQREDDLGWGADEDGDAATLGSSGSAAVAAAAVPPEPGLAHSSDAAGCE
jgi:hypothetical protein